MTHTQYIALGKAIRKSLQIGDRVALLPINADENPIAELKEYLDKTVTIEKGRKTPNKLEYQFKINTPNNEGLNQATRLPWSSHDGWAVGIENGIDGLKRFLYWIISPKSRSGLGLQAPNNDVREDEMTTTEYVPTFLKNFIENIKSKFKFIS